MGETKRVQCSSKTCAGKRRHHEDDTPRGPQYIDVPIDHPGPWYCSIECSMYK